MKIVTARHLKRLRSERGSLELIQNAIVAAVIGVGLITSYYGLATKQQKFADHNKCIVESVSIDPKNESSTCRGYDNGL